MVCSSNSRSSRSSRRHLTTTATAAAAAVATVAAALLHRPSLVAAGVVYAITMAYKDDPGG